MTPTPVTTPSGWGFVPVLQSGQSRHPFLFFNYHCHEEDDGGENGDDM